MPISSSLTVVVPRLLERLQYEHIAGAPEESLLALAAGRGELARRWPASDAEHARLEPWQYGMLAALDLDPGQHPSAAMHALGQDCQGTIMKTTRNTYWLHVEPIHLAAGLNDVVLVPLRPAAELTADEHDALHETLGMHLAAEGFAFVRARSGGWLLGSAEDFDVTTVHPAFAARHEWNVVLPQGAGAGRVRRLMTELQMLLHDHPVNAARAARGVPAANALWLWGGATRSASPRPPAAVCIGRNAYLHGVSLANGWPRPIEARHARDMLQACSTPSTVAVLDDVTPSAFEADWLPVILDALKMKRIERLELVLDEWLVTLDRWRWRRFWRRPLRFMEWGTA